MNRRELLTATLATGAAMGMSGRADAGIRNIKCVIVGVGAVGKTCSLISFTTNAFPGEYIPTVYDNYSATIMRNEQPVQLGLWDTAGSDDYDRLRPLSYPEADVVIIAFSVIRESTFDNVQARWLPELREHIPDVPMLLSGFKSDLRGLSESHNGITEVDPAAPLELVEAEGLGTYRECSALTQEGLAEAFYAAIDLALGIDPDANPLAGRLRRPQIDRDRLMAPRTRPRGRPGSGGP